MDIGLTYSYSPIFVMLGFGVIAWAIFGVLATKLKRFRHLLVSVAVTIAAIVAVCLAVAPSIENSKNQFAGALREQAQEVYGIELTQEQAASLNSHLLPVGGYSEGLITVSVDGESRELLLHRETEDRYILLIQELSEPERR